MTVCSDAVHGAGHGELHEAVHAKEGFVRRSISEWAMRIRTGIGNPHPPISVCYTNRGENAYKRDTGESTYLAGRTAYLVGRSPDL